MNPMDPRPHDFDRTLADRQAEMRRSSSMARFAHSRTRMLAHYVGSLVERLDPTGRERRRSRSSS
jgi:hypothetical protein